MNGEFGYFIHFTTRSSDIIYFETDLLASDLRLLENGLLKFEYHQWIYHFNNSIKTSFWKLCTLDAKTSK